MGFPGDDDSRMTYVVVVNAEDEYSIWPDNREIPAGWRDTGKRGTRDDCLAYVKKVWADRHPTSPPKEMDGDKGEE